MNKTNLLVALFLTATTIMIFNYFNNKNQQKMQPAGVPAQVLPGQSYKVPTAQDLARPINTEIDFIDKKMTQKEDIKEVETGLYNVSFSNYGGIISNISFKKFLGKNKTPLRTIQPVSFYQREEGAFLIALDEKTPYFYKFAEVKDLGDQKTVLYQAQTENWIINKTYFLNDNNYKIDILLDFVPKLEQDKNLNSVRSRIFFPAPFIGEVTDDKISAFSSSIGGQNIDIINANNLDSAWVAPAIFGAQDKYFAHCLVADTNNYVQRAMFKKVGNKLYPVLEGPEIKEKSEYKISFYIGPKLVDDLGSVDQRLEELLSFGWLSWLCKLLLAFLNLIVSYVKNYGLAIIILTFLIKIPFTPLTMWGRKKMEAYQKHQPAIGRIRTKFKDDLRRQQEEIVRYHKEHNLSPTSTISGCLPLVIQMPILFALYRVLNGYLSLYQAPLFGWITDLSSKDPYYVLPILMGGSMILQQLMAPVTDSKQKVMMLFMPVVFTAIFINFPAGLVLYWLTNNLLTVGEDYLRKKIVG
ncbi:YidC/Oxa1 family insertase periplasmic-domain containing protein [Candidatus Babeliales bacterium]|nr:YidC/Oxa1 family insertase periplasmic-domain containing protein [Candidatus Babeliales bacterium]